MGGEISMKDLVFKHSIFDGLLSNVNMRLKAAQVDNICLNISWQNIYKPIQIKFVNVRFLVMPIVPQYYSDDHIKTSLDQIKTVEKLEQFFIQ
mmetsp:Transcript_81187/g.175455  ORF Transcript_81187/g.175455 Transcript_81187/m.175455 type:complete len:93 (-) Transcript_81187:19-297(-)